MAGCFADPEGRLGQRGQRAALDFCKQGGGVDRLDTRQRFGNLLQQPRFGQFRRQRRQCIEVDARQFVKGKIVKGKGLRQGVDFQ